MPGLDLRSDMNFAGQECSQCGKMHPPILDGSRCPAAKVKIEGVKDEDVRKFIGNLSNIILFNIESKKIQNPENIFKEITMLVAKYLDEVSK
jgi:hypothetical protein